MGLRNTLPVIIIGLIVGCGVKKAPKPPPLPHYDVKRIGSKVYLIPLEEGIEVKGFEMKRGFLVKERSSSFCFEIKKREGRRVYRCIGEAVREKPTARVHLKRDRAIVKLEESGIYRLYPVRDTLIPRTMKEIRGDEFIIERVREKRTYALTKVIGSVESEPLFIEIPPIKPTPPPPPRDIGYVVRDGYLYLHWRGDAEGYLIYRDGKPLTEKPVRGNVFVDELPSGEAVYEILAVGEDGITSEPVRFIYRP